MLVVYDSGVFFLDDVGNSDICILEVERERDTHMADIDAISKPNRAPPMTEMVVIT